MALLPKAVTFARFRSAITATKGNFRRLSDLALVGIGFAKLWGEDSFYAECQKLRMNALWWSKVSINFHFLMMTSLLPMMTSLLPMMTSLLPMMTSLPPMMTSLPP